jgi:PAS domain S-box-containing protein
MTEMHSGEPTGGGRADPGESARLDRLHALQVLDTPAEPLFDRFTRLAAMACQVPIALVSLVDAKRQWFKASTGLSGPRQTPRELSFCTHTVAQGSLLEVPDVLLDARFADKPAALGLPDLRFYAGAPLVLPGGHCVGALCVLDHVPRALLPAQREQLQELALAVVDALLLREHVEKSVGVTERRFRELSDLSPFGVFHTNAVGACTYVNLAWQRIYGMNADEALGHGWGKHLHPDDRDAVQTNWMQSAAYGVDFDCRFRVLRPDGTVRRVHSRARPLRELDGAISGYVGAVDDITEQERADSWFRDLADAAPVGVFRTDAAGRCNYVNATWSEIHGVPQDVGLGDGWIGVLELPERSEALRRWRSAVARGQDVDAQYSIVRPSGALRQVHMRGRALRGVEGEVRGYVGVVHDLTDRIGAEQRQAQAEALLAQASQLAGVGAWRLELLPEPELHWSAQTAVIHDRPVGYQATPEEALAYYADDGSAQVRAALEQVVAQGGQCELELPLTTAKGRRIWVRILGKAQADARAASGRVVRVLGAMQDVTARRERDAALAASHEQLRQLYEQTPALLVSIDAQGQVLDASDALLVRLGLHRNQVQEAPTSLLDWLLPISRTPMARHTLPRLFIHGQVERVACSLHTAKGERMEVLLSAIALQGGERALAVLDDVTQDTLRAAELRQAQAQRLQIEAHARDLNELLAERSEMLDVLAHEVRQPLNNASAALQAAGTSLAREGATEASAAVQRAQRVLGAVMSGVDNTLAVAALLAGFEQPSLDDLDLDLLIGIVLAELPTPERSRLQLERISATRTVTADLGLMRLALRNLLGNALACSLGAVVLRLSDSDAPLALFMEVQDSGPGIDDEVLPRLFQRGARSRQGSARSSHGLGLYIVRRAMELQGGSASLVSTGAQGTVMRLQLPV